MSDRRPERVYAILVREGHVFLVRHDGGHCLPGGVFRPMAEDRKVELKAHLWDQLGIEATRVWAQGAFEYRAPGEPAPHFSGFYTVWAWDGEVSSDAGDWLDADGLAAATIPAPLKILLTSVVNTLALRTR